MIKHTFQGCQIGIYPYGAEEGEKAAKTLVIIDPHSGQTFDFTMPSDVAANIGSELRMGNKALAAKREEEQRRAQQEALAADITRGVPEATTALREGAPSN